MKTDSKSPGSGDKGAEEKVVVREGGKESAQEFCCSYCLSPFGYIKVKEFVNQTQSFPKKSQILSCPMVPTGLDNWHSLVFPASKPPLPHRPISILTPGLSF